MFKTLTGTRLLKLTGIAVAIFFLGLFLILFINDQRDKADNRMVRENLANITVAANLYYNQNKEYTKSTMFIAGRQCTGKMFTDVTTGLVGLTGSSDAWPEDVTIICQADGKYYSVSASLPKPIDDDGYWCVDAIGNNGPTRSHQAQGDVTC